MPACIVVFCRCTTHYLLLLYVTQLHLNYSRGSGEFYHLGHGTTDNCRTPKLIDGLAAHRVKDIAVGSHHCLALTSDGTVLGWGRNNNPDAEANIRGSVAVPKVLEAVSKIGVVTISCGSHEVLDARG